MTEHATGTRKEWLDARIGLAQAEKAHMRQSDELARQQPSLLWVRIDREYRFDIDQGSARLTGHACQQFDREPTRHNEASGAWCRHHDRYNQP